MAASVKKTLAALSVGGLALGLSACGNDAEEVPQLSEIQEQMWDSMEASESVRVSVEIPEEALDDPALSGFGSDEIVVFGDTAGTVTAYSLSGSTMPAVLVFEDAEYVSVDFLVGTMRQMAEAFGGELPPEEEEVLSAMTSEFGGKWLDAEELGAGGMGLSGEGSMAGLLAEARQSFFEASEDEAAEEGEGDDFTIGGDSNTADFISAENLPQEGVYADRDGVDVWIFADEETGAELVVEADSDSPRMLFGTDGETSVSFSEWDTVELPERPSDEDLITEEQMMERMAELGMM